MSRVSNRDVLIREGNFTESQIASTEKELNALHSFRTYSYHHILIAANTTAAAQYAIDAKELSAWMHESTYEDKYKPKTPPGMPAGKDAYMILINGMTDSEFAIQAMEIETIIDPSARSSNPHASFVEGTLEIMEPKGMRFMNLLKHACDSLQSPPHGLTFILKTIFVGYTDGMNGEPKIQQLIDTKPIQFLMVDITGEFTSAGSTYQIQLVGNINGTPRLPIFSKLEQSNVTGGTVSSALGSLEKQLNESAVKAYETLSKQLDESNNANRKTDANPDQYLVHGRKVVYKIVVAPEFAELPLDNVHARNMGADGSAQLAAPRGIDIETAITDVLMSSTKISEIMNADITKGYKTIFKIDSSLVTTIEAAEITFAVKRCRVPVTIKDNRQNAGEVIPPDISNRYVIEFDYLFTGKNIEVLEYDMKMTMGIAFFQSFGSSSNIPGSFNGSSGDIVSLGSGSATAMNKDIPVMHKYAIIPNSGIIQDASSRNKQEPAKTADFRTFMARQAAFESINAKLRVAGIPWLLEAFNTTADEVSDLSASSLKEQIPLIKINVMMPARDVDFISGNKPFAETFWYEGFFQIISVKNIFKDGRFEQEFDLVSTLYEEIVTPQGSGGTSSKVVSSVGKVGDKSPTQATPSTKKQAPPANTAEQKAKQGITAKPLSSEEKLNCQNVRKQPITMESARRTYLSKTITLEQLIRRPVNIPYLDDRIMNNLCALAKNLEAIQEVLGHRITITSGFRCAAYNAGTKGSSKTSDHMQAVAADFICPAYGSPEKIFNALKNSGLDFRQVIWETSASASWVHVSFNIQSGMKPVAASHKFMHMRV
jgi:uncharacterized protein YcbK (DUF882 family)